MFLLKVLGKDFVVVVVVVVVVVSLAPAVHEQQDTYRLLCEKMNRTQGMGHNTTHDVKKTRLRCGRSARPFPKHVRVLCHCLL